LEDASWRAGCLHYCWVEKLDLRGRRKALFALRLFSYTVRAAAGARAMRCLLRC